MQCRTDLSTRPVCCVFPSNSMRCQEGCLYRARTGTSLAPLQLGDRMTTDERDDLPKVSIIVPHLNQIDWLEESLAALHAQAYPSDRTEIVVVDNGSGQAALDWLAARADVTIYHEGQPGPGLARNKGVAHAQHDFLAFIDSDCIADPDWLSSAVRTLQAHPDIAVGGDVRIGVEDAGNWTDLEAYESVFAYRQKEYIERLHFSGTGNLAMTRATYQKVGPFAGINVAEDRDWGKRAWDLGVKTVYNPSMVVYHPARKSLDEMRQKWRRHVLHDYEDHRNAQGGTTAWLFRAFAVFGSGFVHIFKILQSDRAPGIVNKIKAARCLIAIRSFRARFMLQVSGLSDEELKMPKWNR